MTWQVLMGANVANEVAQGQFCEATLGCDDQMTAEQQDIALKLFDAQTFRVRAVHDVAGVELCGALKNVVALGAGFCDGLSFGGNTKAAIIRIGLQEMTSFIRHFHPHVKTGTFLESCGVADLITTCFGGRNRKCAEAYVRAGGKKNWEEIEKDLLGGQKLQGTLTAQEIWPVMKEHGLCDALPLLTTVYQIAFESKPASSIVELAPQSPGKRVTIIGSGNWGCAIAKIIAENTARHPEFATEITMWMFEEMVEHLGETRKLSEVFNETKENIKYLPGITLPSNLIAEPDVKKAVENADILVWVLPHQFVPRTVKSMGQPKPGAMSVSLIKGGLELEGGNLGLCSDLLRKLLGHSVSVLMGANVANEVAQGQFCEATLGCDDQMTAEQQDIALKLFDAQTFRVRAVHDVAGVELCGALKNVVALGAGFCDGLSFGGNTKAAIIRIGLQKIMSFVRHFYPHVKTGTFLESCGVADLITTCFGGRNRKCAEAYVRAGGKKNWEEIEKDLLGGQKLQGTLTAQEIWPVMKEHGLCESLPLLTTIYQIAFENKPASSVVELAPQEASGSEPGAKRQRVA